ncbi:MAG TPA: hypothetical protein VE221_09515 [Sphingomicrobium sp.]|nr:hypothetical protein [Sphingomicrobium sp.]
MEHRLYMGMALALGLITSPALAQPTSDQTNRDRGAMNRDATTRHDTSRHDTYRHDTYRHDMTRHGHMWMHRGMSDSHMMRWCRSMSHRRMMMNPSCRAMMHMRYSHRMHHM